MNFALASQLMQRRVEAAMNSTIQIQRGDLGSLDENTLMVTGIKNLTVIYEGKAHIHNVMGAGVISVGEAPIDTTTVTISIPFSAALPRRDDLVSVLTDGDPDLPARTFRVLDVNVGGLLSAYHSMTCQGYREDRYWPA